MQKDSSIGTAVVSWSCDWTLFFLQVTRAISQKIRGLQHRARAVLSLGNTIFVDPMVHCHLSVVSFCQLFLDLVLVLRQEVPVSLDIKFNVNSGLFQCHGHQHIFLSPVFLRSG